MTDDRVAMNPGPDNSGAWGRVTAGQRAGLMSSQTDEWATPQGLFDELHREFHFTLDPCASPENAKCRQFFTKDEDGLNQTWTGRVFMNPPYGRGIGRWVGKAYGSAARHGALVVCLLPARTDTTWWHRYCMKAQEIRLIRGRVQFGNIGVNAPFPSAVVVFDGKEHSFPTVSSWKPTFGQGALLPLEEVV